MWVQDDNFLLIKRIEAFGLIFCLLTVASIVIGLLLLSQNVSLDINGQLKLNGKADGFLVVL